MSDAIVIVLARGTVDAAVPYAFAALGGVVSERSGLANVALEASLLAGAFAASAAVVAGGGFASVVVSAALTGAFVGVAHALFAVVGRASSIVVGMALNLAALGLTKGLLRVVYGSSANGPSFALRLDHVASVGVTFLVAAAVHYAVNRTTAGTRLRAVGESRSLAASVGFQPRAVQTYALMVGHALAALGGAALCLSSGQFQSQMSAGRGFLALALVILGRWEVWPTVGGVVALAVLEASEVFVQDLLGLPSEAVLALPFLVILPVLALGAGRMKGARIPRFEA